MYSLRRPLKHTIYQLQVANLLARAPQAHMASDRGVTWHTPTPPPHLYHVPAPSPPDPLQVCIDLEMVYGWVLVAAWYGETVILYILMLFCIIEVGI